MIRNINEFAKGSYLSTAAVVAFLTAIAFAVLLASVTIFLKIRRLLGQYVWLPALTSEEFWASAIMCSATIFAGLMWSGYAVFDELAVYFVLVLAVLIGPRPAKFTNEGGLKRFQSGLFIALMLFLAIQSVRGIFVLGDIRVARFLFLFVALGWIGWRWSRQNPIQHSLTVARVVVSSTVLYFTGYMSVGLVGELIFRVWRFDQQGHVWVGTTAAFVPGFVMLPALVRICFSAKSVDRWLFWLGSVLLLIAAFYYQSRLGWMAIFFLIGSIFVAGRGTRGGVLAVGSLMLVVFFPWNDPRPLTVSEVKQYVSAVADDLPKTQPAGNLIAFTDAVFGSFVPHRIATEVVVIRPNGSRFVIPAQLTSNEQISKLKAAGFSISTRDMSLLSTDIDRKLAIVAAIRAAVSRGIFEALFGSGYYTHRFELLPYIHQVAGEFHYVFPPTYDSIVRTATMNGMLVDTGIIGVSTVFALFALALWSGVQKIIGSTLESRGMMVSLLGALCVLGLSLFAGSNYDMIILYLALVPNGPMLGCMPLGDLSTDEQFGLVVGGSR